MTAYYLFSHCVGLTLPPWSRDFPEPHLVRKFIFCYFYLFLFVCHVIHREGGVAD